MASENDKVRGAEREPVAPVGTAGGSQTKGYYVAAQEPRESIATG